MKAITGELVLAILVLFSGAESLGGQSSPREARLSHIVDANITATHALQVLMHIKPRLWRPGGSPVSFR